MKKRAAIFAAIATTTVLGIATFACSSDTGSTFQGPGTDAGTTFSEAGFNVDSRAPVDSGTTVNCNPALPVNFNPTFDVPVATNDCTADQIAQYYDNCLAVNDGGTLKVNDPSCTSWLSANKQCGNCLEQDETDTTSGPIQYFHNRLYFTINTAGCVGIEQNQTDSTSCAYNDDLATQCRRQSCQGCFDKSGVNFTNFTDCENAAIKTGKCQELTAAKDQACIGSRDAGSPANNCFPIPDSSEAKKSFYGRVMGIFCAKQ